MPGKLTFEADAKDVDGFESLPSALRTLRIVADQPPTATIVKPSSDDSVVIEGQDIEVFVEAIDDLGPEGIDRVAFHVNGEVAETAYDSLSEITGSAAV